MAQVPDCLPGAEYRGIRELVVGPHPVAAHIHEIRRTQGLQVLRCVGHRHVGQFGEFLHAPLALSDEIHEFEASRAGQGPGDAGELPKQFVFEFAVSE